MRRMETARSDACRNEVRGGSGAGLPGLAGRARRARKGGGVSSDEWDSLLRKNERRTGREQEMARVLGK